MPSASAAVFAMKQNHSSSLIVAEFERGFGTAKTNW